MNKQKTFLPVTLDLTNKKILLVGDGESALKKLKILLRFTCDIEVLSENPLEEFFATGVPVIHDKYHSRYLDGKSVVYASTDDIVLDTCIMEDCHRQKILVNVHDRPDLCDFVSPAVYQHGSITVSVGSNATNVFQSIEIRNRIAEFLEREYFNKNNQTK